MKQEVSRTTTKTTTRRRAEGDPGGSSFSTTTPSRLRPSSSKGKDSSVPKPETESGNGASPLCPKERANSVTTRDTNLPKNQRRPIVVNRRPKSGEEEKEVRAASVRSRNRSSAVVVEQFARPRPRLQRQLLTPDLCNPKSDTGVEVAGGGDDDLDGKKKMKELQEKRLDDRNETLIRNLQSEVLELKAELDKAQSLNAELQSLNRKLSEDLAAAQAKIGTTLLTSPPFHQGESVADYQTPTFKDIQKLIATKLEHSKVKTEAINDPSPTRALMASTTQPVPAAFSDLRITACQPPPPPPPPPGRAPVKATITPREPAAVESFHSSTKPDRINFSSGSGNHDKLLVLSAHSSIVGEIQKRSTHLLAIRTDIETKGEFINSLIQKVLDAAYTDIEDVLKFVDWLDHQLLTLADERAVLKHFKWPERKADALREAAIEYRGLKLLESELSSHKDDASIPCGVALKKMAGLLDKSERSIQRLIKLRSSVVLSYQQFKIPVEWMLDSGFIIKVKQASMMLAKIYLKRVITELESVQHSERESIQEGLLLQGIHFAYRAHQFAGGLDSETECAFEEIRQRIPGHLRESQILLAGIPSS